MRRDLIPLLFFTASLGCAGNAGDYGAADAPGSGLSPGGAQDFGRFKAILRSGRVPAPETLDQVGFFAEHKVGDPPTACPGPVCAEPLLGSMANMISGSNCTLIHLSLGSPLDPKQVGRPAVDVAVVVDSGSPAVGSGLSYVRQGVERLLSGLVDGDRAALVSVVGDGYAESRGGLVPRVQFADLSKELRQIVPAATSNIYDALRLGMDTLGPAQAGRHRRVVLVSAGQAGPADPERIARLAQTFAEGGGGVTVLAIGMGGDVRLLQALADAGAGTLYYVDAPSELPAVFDREVGYSLIPVAERVQVKLTPGAPYRLREVFGLSSRSVSLAADAGRIQIPALFVAWRKDVAGSWSDRRGGGGAILIEVLPKKDADPRQRPSQVADIELSYRVPGTGEEKTLVQRLISPDGPGEAPSLGRFAGPAVEKGFVVLNVYVALRMASERATVGDLRGAHEILSNILMRAGEWEKRKGDAEIRDDLTYVKMFLSILEKRGALQQPPRAGWFNEPWPRD